MESDFKNKVQGQGKDGKDIPFAVIDMRAYGMMDGVKVLQQAEDLING